MPFDDIANILHPFVLVLFLLIKLKELQRDIKKKEEKTLNST